MKCPYCNGSGFDDEHMIKCLKCENGIIEPTHQEFIQNCNTEELAEFLSRYIGICAVCKYSEECDYEEIISTYKCPYGDDNRKAWEMWLKEKKE